MIFMTIIIETSWKATHKDNFAFPRIHSIYKRLSFLLYISTTGDAVSVNAPYV